MATFLTIDGGTTNTRIGLLQARRVVDMLKLPYGAGSARKENIDLSSVIRDGIFTILQRNGLQEKDVKRILASGMITSEYGLYNAPHLVAPVGLAELNGSTIALTMPAITSIPFLFIRGVKCVGDSFAQTDMMRGEETELMGLWDPAYGACVYVLPGSHSKVIKTDAAGRIETFSTLLSGEMFYALSRHTILGDAVDMSADGMEKDYLLQGYEYAREHGVNKAVFKARVLKNHFAATREAVTSFFRGVILCDEIREILRYDTPTVVLGGKKQMREATAEILSHVCDKRVICLDDATVEASVPRGQLRIYYGE